MKIQYQNFLQFKEHLEVSEETESKNQLIKDIYNQILPLQSALIYVKSKNMNYKLEYKIHIILHCLITITIFGTYN